jgi:hypothetical protein
MSEDPDDLADSFEVGFGCGCVGGVLFGLLLALGLIHIKVLP